jgi:hypothetical protein
MCPEHILLQELLGVVRVRWQAATRRKPRDFLPGHLRAALRDQVQLLSSKWLLVWHVPRVMTWRAPVLRRCRRVLHLPARRQLLLGMLLLMKVRLLRLRWRVRLLRLRLLPTSRR